jgi:hypothetical protein
MNDFWRKHYPQVDVTYWQITTPEGEKVTYEAWVDPDQETSGCDAEDEDCSGPWMLIATKHDIPMGYCTYHATGHPDTQQITQEEYNQSCH